MSVDTTGTAVQAVSVLTGWGLNKLTGGALTSIAGALASGLIKGVLGINAGVVNITAGTVTGVPGTGAPGGGDAGRALHALLAARRGRGHARLHGVFVA